MSSARWLFGLLFLVAARFGEGSGESLLHGAGDYRLGIETSQPYEISVHAVSSTGEEK